MRSTKWCDFQQHWLTPTSFQAHHYSTFNYLLKGSLFIISSLGGTRSLRMPALRPASQPGPMRNPREGTSVMLRDTIRLTWLCVVCCATSPYRELCRAKGGIGSGDTLCHDIYPARPITTVSLVANTYCMMDDLSSCAPRTVGPRVQCVWTEPLMTGQCIQQEEICYQWFKQRLILSVSKPSISQRSQIKRGHRRPLCACPRI